MVSEIESFADQLGKIERWLVRHPEAFRTLVKDHAAMLEAAPQPDTVEPVAYVERYREYNTSSSPVLSRVIGYPALAKLPNGTELYARPPAQPDTVAVDERAEFERLCIVPNAYSNERTEHGHYVQPGLERMWRYFNAGFSAARALLDQEK